MFNRLKEPTTWIGIIALLGLVGVSFQPELQSELVKLGVAIGGVLAIWLPESK